MKVFISEYVCGGGWPQPLMPHSLLREGRAMLQAIVDDFARVSDCRVVTTLDSSQPPLPVENVEIIRVRGPEEEADAFVRLAAEADTCMVIAPEIDNVLVHRCKMARAAGAQQLLNPDQEIIELSSDKLRLYEFLVEQGIPTIPTARWTANSLCEFDWSPIVIKPRFGAGSQGAYVFESVEVAQRAVFSWSARESGELGELIVQPLVRGSAVSVGVIESGIGKMEVFPVAAQHLTDNGRFEYRGGHVPWRGTTGNEVRNLIRKTCQELRDLRGYVGFDLIVPSHEAEEPLLVEINPRLTTSYLGYRALAGENLAARLLRPEEFAEPVCWNRGNVEFSADGRVVMLSESELAK